MQKLYDISDIKKDFYYYMKKETQTIKCPVCGYEYLPSEIFLPDDFTGKQTGIIRDDNGEIICFSTKEKPCLEQEFVCDHCNSAFKVKAVISYEVKACPEHDFDEDYIVKIK